MTNRPHAPSVWERAGTRLTDDGLTRRRVLQLGGLGGLGLTLPQFLQAQAAQTTATSLRRSPIKSCIFIFFYGGPSHLDTWDMKPSAPAEVRGEFQSIATAVPGLRISEHLPRMAKVMRHVALIRGMCHSMRNHDSACTQTFTGRVSPRGDVENFSAPDESLTAPGYGAALSYVRRRQPTDLPHAALPFFIRNLFPPPGQAGGFLGAAYHPFLIEGDPKTQSYRAELLDLPPGLTDNRVRRRSDLLHALRRSAEGDDIQRPFGDDVQRPYYDKALQLLASKAVRRALNIVEEPRAVRERYGLTWPGLTYAEDNITPELRPALPLRGQNLLMARRLVEAGVPFVNVYDFRVQGANWDTHTENFARLKGYLLPSADQALSALIEDLEARGLLDSTLVVAVGEFGRTPKINPQKAGREHWPDCYSAILAGGGVRGGAVYGSSDKLGAYPATCPTTPADLAATIFWAFGVDPRAEIPDRTGRPLRLADGEPIHQLF